MKATVSVLGVEMEVDYSYSPPQKEVRYTSTGDPGCEGLGEEFEIDRVEIGGQDATGLLDDLWKRGEKGNNGAYRYTHVFDLIVEQLAKIEDESEPDYEPDYDRTIN